MEALSSERVSLTRPSRVLVVDDHGIPCDAVTTQFAGRRDLQVVGGAQGGSQTAVEVCSLRPDVVIVDLASPDLDGIDATRRILTLLPDTHVVILSACHTSARVIAALRAGARGYVLKESGSPELMRAVLAVLAGGRYFSPSISDMLLGLVLSNPTSYSPIERLSGREREVLHLTVAGTTSAEIATRMSLSRKTVDTYRSRVMDKVGVKDLGGLIRFAAEHAMAPA